MKRLLIILSVCGVPAMAPAFVALPALAATTGSLGDLSSFEAIARDTLKLATAGDMPAAEKRITDYETAWDAAEPKLYSTNKQQWTVVDDASDGAIKALRKAKPNAKLVDAALTKLISTLQNPTAN